MSGKLSRRTVIKGLTVAAIAPPDIVPAAVLGPDSPSNQITMGFIGTGNNGTGWLKEFLKDNRVRVIAVCDVNREGPGYWDGTTRGREPARQMVDEAYGGVGCAAYEDFRKVIARDDIDAVYIATPDHWHAIMAIESANAGKDIFCQKPLSLSIGEGRAMV
ncbi:MAG TPA: Gfo/Idh/MocA family oxidoreductase [bacterium]|nr:Gfo/Idh/MocA family oxidoreductase [bacterium]